MSKRIIVLGAGPKALALTAKRWVLNELGITVPEILIIEMEEVGANWLGKFGFTDGEQELGTPPGKDIGFPYLSVCWGKFNDQVNEAMSKFSWQNFLIQQQKYAEWLDRGRPQPPHKRWGEYLKWISMRSEANVKKGEVTRITQVDNHWNVYLKGSNEAIDGEALVITGPGEPQKMQGQPENHPRIMDGRDYWSRISDAQLQEISIGIIGTGETAASIAVSLLNLIDTRSNVEIINPHGTIYSRGESFIENSRFSNPNFPDSWSALIEEDRLEFINRTDRGVFSMQAKSALDSVETVKSRTGRVRGIGAAESGIRVNVEYADVTNMHSYDFVIVATGFDPLSFKQLFDDSIVIQNWGKNKIEHEIDNDLSLRNYIPKIHLPMLSAFAQGPGFPNLSSLGLLSDRILSSYVSI